ncbi:MAG: metal ABC transporter solute-binding protein, Zn/Mn family [Paracoccaceae bacterium]
MLTKRGFLGLAVSAASVAVLAPPLRAAQPLSVVATTGMIADAARAIAGETAEVTALMGPGVDPHSYRQTRSDIVAMSRADLVLWNGHYLEAQIEGVLRQLASRTRVVAVAEAAPREALIAHDDYPDKADPHLWLVPELWAHAISATRDALIDSRPEETEAFRAGAADCLDEAERMGRYAREVLSSVPERSRVLLTAHDAFNYFGRAYGFEVVGIQGISTESEAGLARIRDLVDMLVSRDIRAVFVESSVSDRNIRALVEGAASRGHSVAVGGELFSDAMGKPGTYEGTWLGMIDHNATVIARALGGSAPARGRDGRLAAGS